MNYFCEKHGKNLRDAHFSCISRFITSESLRKRLCSTGDIVNAISEGQRIANENCNFTFSKTFMKFINFNQMLKLYKYKLMELQQQLHFLLILRLTYI